jgi:hypothetical protein
MTKLKILCAIAAMSATFGAAGCKTKNTENRDQPAAKPAETLPTPAPKPDEAKPDEAKPDVAKPMATTELPAACAEYKASVDKLASCDKLPADVKTSLKTSYDQAAASWTTTPADGMTKLGESCKTAADAVKQAAGTTCGW